MSTWKQPSCVLNVPLVPGRALAASARGHLPGPQAPISHRVSLGTEGASWLCDPGPVGTGTAPRVWWAGCRARGGVWWPPGPEKGAGTWSSFPPGVLGVTAGICRRMAGHRGRELGVGRGLAPLPPPPSLASCLCVGSSKVPFPEGRSLFWEWRVTGVPVPPSSRHSSSSLPASGAPRGLALLPAPLCDPGAPLHSQCSERADASQGGPSAAHPQACPGCPDSQVSS